MSQFIPYGRQWISEEDINAVVEVLKSDWLTQGPAIAAFEERVAAYCGARFAVAVANGTAALHLAALAAGFGNGDEVITSPITFVASSNCILHAGAKPIFADIDPLTYCIDAKKVAASLSPRTKGIVAVHFAGLPAGLAELSKLASQRQLILIEDAAHALGATYQVDNKTYRVGSCAHSDMTTLSFHPVKHITTGEGGVITTNNETLYRRLLMLRTHGITRDPEQLSRNEGPWFYEMQDLGFNYRLTDFQAALGSKQLERLDAFVERRREIASAYDKAFEQETEIILPHDSADARSSYHLYVVQLRSISRGKAFESLRSRGIGVNVHYIPVHLQPYYIRTLGHKEGDFPVAESYYGRAISLPMFPAMKDQDIQTVVRHVLETLQELKN